MLTRDDVMHFLEEHRETLRSMGAVRLGVFGSFARGEAGPDSDLDILVQRQER